jgi:hypothetical protein
MVHVVRPTDGFRPDPAAPAERTDPPTWADPSPNRIFEWFCRVSVPCCRIAPRIARCLVFTCAEQRHPPIN